MSKTFNILHLEDSEEDAELIKRTLDKSGLDFSLTRVEDKVGFIESLENNPPSIIVADYNLPLFSGLQALEITRQMDNFIPFIFVSGALGETQAVNTLKMGADDYILKDRMERLPQAIIRALDESKKKNELKAVTETLRKNETRFRNLVETSIDCIWQVNKDWIFEYVSPRSIDIMGYTQNDMIGQKLFDFFISKGNEEEELFRHSGSREKPIRLKELIHKHKENKRLILEVSANPLYDNNGHMVGYDGNYRDITERKANESKLLAESGRSQLLLRLPLIKEDIPLDDFIFKYLEELCKITESQTSYSCLCINDAYNKKIFIHTYNKKLSAWQNRIDKINFHFPLSELDSDYSHFLNENGLEEAMSYPLIGQNKIDMISGIVKDTGEYSDFDRESIELISSETWRIIKTEIQAKEILESRQRLEEVQKLASLGHWSWDRETGFIEFSPFLANLLGSEKNIRITKIEDLKQYFSRRGLLMLVSHLRNCLKKGNEFILDLAMDNRNRKQTWITIRGIPKYSQDRSIKGIYGTIQDISQRIVSEEHMRELAQAVDQSNESIVITDINGDIKYINDAFKTTSGFSLKELIGLNPRILQSGKTPESTYVELWTKLVSGEVWSGELWNKRKDGSEYIEHAIITPLKSSDGSIIGYVGVKEDITEKKQMSQDLEKHRYNLEKLVEERTNQLKIALEESYNANKIKEQFLANISHEIRTPLNAMMVLLHMLKKTDLNTYQMEKIIKIQISSKHLLSLINNLLDYSKIDSGKLSLESVKIDISAILNSVKSILISKAEEKNLKLIVETQDIPVGVLGDPTRLSQAILNLVNNAIKFTEKGEVCVRAKIVKIDSNYLHMGFEVEDNGPGIPESEIDRLFTPFEQLDSSTTRSHGGTGLGLAITKQLAKLMGGECGAASIIGKGSIFWFTASFKIQETKVDDEEGLQVDYLLDEKAYLEKFKGKKILLVEDDPINQEVASELLQDFGFIVELASNGKIAVDYMKKSINCHIILMDMHMPVMDGLDATKAIRKLDNAGEIPIIAMTGNAFLEDKIHCYDAGMNDIILKPIDPEELFNSIYKWLEKKPVKINEEQIPSETGYSLNNISSFQGIDIAQINKIFDKDLSRFFTLARTFFQSYKDTHTQCLEFLGSESFKSAVEVIHKMSGAAGTLGLSGIHKISRQIEPKLKAHSVNVEEVILLINSLETAFVQLELFLENSGHLFEDNVMGEYSKESYQNAYNLLKQLKVLLKNYDTESQIFYNENKGLFNIIFPLKAAILQKHLESFEYQMAIEVIEELESGWKL